MASRKNKSSKVKGKKSLKYILQLVFSVLLILTGAGILGYSSLKNFDFSLTRQLPMAAVETEHANNQFSKIKSIHIPKIKRNLAVEDGSVVSGRWEVSREGVSFYTQSKLPEEGGNTVLYGHNKARILGGLVDVRRGDKIDLTLENGDVFHYEVFEVKTIEAGDVSILNETDDSRLTIYTCSGFLDSARFVALAKPVSGDSRRTTNN